jgi:hypothetical protein
MWLAKTQGISEVLLAEGVVAGASRPACLGAIGFDDWLRMIATLTRPHRLCGGDSKSVFAASCVSKLDTNPPETRQKSAAIGCFGSFPAMRETL